MDVKATFRRAPANLRLLMLMRAAAVIAAALILYGAYCLLGIRLPLAPLAGVLGSYAVVGFATFLRLAHRSSVTDLEILAQLLLDAALLAVLLYFTGGARNPLALCYVLLVLYGAMALPERLAWVLAAACLLSYIALHFFYVALPLGPAGIEDVLDYFARFLIYAFIAALIAWFGTKLGELQRLQRAQSRAEAEKDARERYLVGLAALSAGTVHELRTPLSTMSVVIGELRNRDAPPSYWKDDIDTLWSQLQLCRRSLAAMADAAGVERLGKTENVPAGEFLAHLAARFRSLRPAVLLKLRLDAADGFLLRSDASLTQALISFLNNAAEASPRCVELRAGEGRLDRPELVIEVLDRGPGIAPQLRERIGKGLVTTRAEGSGNGSGVLIAQAAIERFGGAVALSDRPGGGTCVHIRLPVFRSSEESEDDDYLRSRTASR